MYSFYTGRDSLSVHVRESSRRICLSVQVFHHTVLIFFVLFSWLQKFDLVCSPWHTLWQVLWCRMDWMRRGKAMWRARCLLQATWFLCREKRSVEHPFLCNEIIPKNSQPDRFFTTRVCWNYQNANSKLCSLTTLFWRYPGKMSQSIGSLPA